jgi:hypothetical protein
MRERQQNSTAHPITFLIVSSTDHNAGLSGLSPAVTVSKDGGAFAAAAGAVSEVGNGWYALAGNATDRNTLGAFLVHATAPGADPCDVQYTIVGYDPFNGTSLGLGNLDTNVGSRLATSSYTAPPTASAVAQAVLTDTADLSTTGSVGFLIAQNLDAKVSSRSTYAGGAVASVAAPVTVGTNNDKTGYALAPTGLDAIPATAPAGVATTFPQMVVALWRRFFAKTTLTASQLKTYANDGTTVLTTQSVSDDGTTQTQGAAS